MTSSCVNSAALFPTGAGKLQMRCATGVRRPPGIRCRVRKNANAIEGFDEPEHAFQDLGFREIPLYFLIGKRVTSRAQFFRCERDIPSLELLDPEFRACELLQFSIIPACVRQRPRGKIVEEVERGLG